MTATTSTTIWFNTPAHGRAPSGQYPLAFFTQAGVNNMILFLDTESYSECDIKRGTYRYAADPSTEVTLLTYAIDAKTVKCWDLSKLQGMPKDLELALDKVYAGEATIAAHNVMHDRIMLRDVLGHDIPISRWVCTMGLALAHSLPAGLAELGRVLGLPADMQKDKDGKRLINLFCKPRPKNCKARRADHYSHPEDWQLFVDYAIRDAETMRECFWKLPSWNGHIDRKVWELDQRINDRGFAVDVEFAQAALLADRKHKLGLSAQMAAATGGVVGSATQRTATLEYINRLMPAGGELPDLTGSRVEMLLADTEPGTALHELLSLRLDASSTTAAKYKVVVASETEGRLRGGLRYCGAARTGRWSGRMFQPQNMARPSQKEHTILQGIEALKLGVEDLVVDDMTATLTSALRGVIIAPPGKKLVVADLSNIEGRVLAWLAGEEWKLQAFRDVDAGRGHDIYVLAYSRSFGVTPEAVLENKTSGDGKMRQIGKVMELALGYQGGVNAFDSMAAIYRLDLEGVDLQGIVNAWRKANPKIKAFWYDMENACKRVLMGAEPVRVGHIRVSKEGRWLRLLLPSGRSLCYPSAKLEDGKITYMGQDQYTRKWKRLETYSGKIAENLAQAVARDIMAHGMLLAEQAGLEVVLTVHDELLTETVDWTVDTLVQCMAAVPTWATGLPLAAAGFETTRYKKG